MTIVCGLLARTARHAGLAHGATGEGFAGKSGDGVGGVGGGGEGVGEHESSSQPSPRAFILNPMSQHEGQPTREQSVQSVPTVQTPMGPALNVSSLHSPSNAYLHESSPMHPPSYPKPFSSSPATKAPHVTKTKAADFPNIDGRCMRCR